MSHEDLRDCIDPIRTPAERQISALQRYISKMRDGYDATAVRNFMAYKAKMEAEVARLTDERLAVERRCHTLKRHLDAIAEALGQPIEHDARKYFKAYQPDQLAGMVRELRDRLTLIMGVNQEIGTKLLDHSELVNAHEDQIAALAEQLAAARAADREGE